MAKHATRPSMGLGWMLAWPFTLVFAAMVFLTVEKIHEPLQDAALAPRHGSPSAERLPERIDAVTNALRATSLPLPEPVEDLQGSAATRHIHRRYDVVLPPDEQERAQLAVETLRAVDPGVSIVWRQRPEGFEGQVAVDGLLSHTLRFQWKKAARPRIALLFDGLGDDLRLARETVGFDGPVAVAVRPLRPFSREVAALAQIFNREVVLQLTPPAPGETAEGEFRIDAREEDLTRRMGGLLASVPNALGVTGDIGAENANDGKRIERLMAELKRRNLFCVGNLGAADPLTGVAAKYGVLIAARALSIDDGGGAVKLATQREAIEAKARTDGAVIVMAHATPEMLEDLARSVNDWRGAGIDLVPLSQILSPAS